MTIVKSEIPPWLSPIFKERNTDEKNRRQIAAFSLIILFITAITAPLSARAEQYVTPHFVKEEKESVEKQEQRFYLIDISGAVTEYVYNAKGLLVEETDPLGAVISYEYDAATGAFRWL